MIQSFLIIAQQTLKVFMLLLAGYICGKTHIMDEVSEEKGSLVALYLTGPCIMLTSFERDFSRDLMQNFALVLALSTLSIILSVCIVNCFFRSARPEEQTVLRTGTALVNCGMFGLALQSSLYGSDGTFYGAAYCAVFNIAVWTYGFISFSKGKEAASAKKVLLNPGFIATLIGIALFFTSQRLPTILDGPMQSLAEMNTPLSMLVIGCRLSHVKLKTLFQGKMLWESAAIGLLGLPLLFLGLFWAIGLRGTAPIATLISICAPAATVSTMFAIQFHCEPNLSVRVVSMQTILSMLTIPLVITAAEFILK